MTLRDRSRRQIVSEALESESPSRYPQPFVKWAGGKAQLIPRISRFLPRHYDRYFEPFLGGGAVFFHLRPKAAIISDANSELINAYRVIRDKLDWLIEALERLQQKQVSQSLFDHYRRLNPTNLSPIERAVRFIFLNKTCFNGLYRVNSQGFFNVPFGKYDRMPKLFDPTNLSEIRNLLTHVEVMCSGYEIALDRAHNGDFTYIDPPYSPEPGSNNFTSYTKEAFSEVDQRRLSAKVDELHRRGCLIMLSNSDTPLIRTLYSKYIRHTVRADRMINCVGSERTGYHELLFTNYEAVDETLLPWVKRAG